MPMGKELFTAFEQALESMGPPSLGVFEGARKTSRREKGGSQYGCRFVHKMTRNVGNGRSFIFRKPAYRWISVAIWRHF